ncbi:tektin-B1-like [Myzus persicae]|uniref:tektin-B1-like n=1 Tax=Myzus persicae TaxID=13164 RepID=UPI000B933928|nr:tektin-B1-like [Myzus persicae]
MSIVTFEKPVPKVAESDWYYKITELKESCDEHRRHAFVLKNESQRLRNDTDVTTYWATHRTNSKIFDRRIEIIRWKNLIELCYKNLQKEIKDLKIEKEKTEKFIEFLNLNFTVTNHCLSIRDERGDADLCHDIASIELKKEQRTLEKLKNLLVKVCQNAWEKINKLEELEIYVAEDLDKKNNTINIDTELLKMTKDSNNISLKPHPLRVPKDFNTYEKWLQQCNNIKQTIENELISSTKLRETMFVPQNKTKNDLLTQNDKVNYSLRRRIYDTERIKIELEWQKWNMLTDKAKFLEEIEKLESALYRKLNPKMLVETRCEERLYRAGVELCLDKSTIGLHKEHLELDNTINMLNDKLNQTKTLHNILIEQINVLDEQLKNKTHALDVDQKCLQYRVQLDGRSYNW